MLREKIKKRKEIVTDQFYLMKTHYKNLVIYFYKKIFDCSKIFSDFSDLIEFIIQTSIGNFISLK